MKHGGKRKGAANLFMTKYRIKNCSIPYVSSLFCAIGRAEEYDICGIWENNGGDCKGCGHYIAHNES